MRQKKQPEQQQLQILDFNLSLPKKCQYFSNGGLLFPHLFEKLTTVISASANANIIIMKAMFSFLVSWALFTWFACWELAHFSLPAKSALEFFTAGL